MWRVSAFSRISYMVHTAVCCLPYYLMHESKWHKIFEFLSAFTLKHEFLVKWHFSFIRSVNEGTINMSGFGALRLVVRDRDGKTILYAKLLYSFPHTYLESWLTTP